MEENSGKPMRPSIGPGRMGGWIAEKFNGG